MVEKRKHKRFKIYQMIQMSIGKENYVSCEGINISKSGMLVKTNKEVDTSARFYFLFEVSTASGNHEIRCEGLAAHMEEVDDGYELGVAFTDLDEEDGKILDLYIDSLKDQSN